MANESVEDSKEGRADKRESKDDYRDERDVVSVDAVE